MEPFSSETTRVDELVEPLPYKAIATIIHKFLLPDFNWERGHTEDSPTLVSPHAHLGPTSRERMEYAREVVERKRRSFWRLRASETYRDVLVDPLFRVSLYRLWLATPRPHLWDQGRYDLKSGLELDRVPDSWGLPSASRWTTSVWREPRTGRKGYYELDPDWYLVGFLHTAYFNHHLEWVTHCSWRVSMRPAPTFKERTQSGLWPTVDEYPPLYEIPDPGPNPGPEASEVALALAGNYDALMVKLYEEPDDIISSAQSSTAPSIASRIDKLDRMGLLAPGVRVLVEKNVWQLEISDDSIWTYFPGAELLLKRDWGQERLKPVMWLRKLMLDLSEAVAHTELIRVPSIRVFAAMHGLWGTDSDEVSQRRKHSRVYNPFSAVERARVAIMCRPGQPGLAIPERRVVFFDAPIRSVDPERVDLMMQQAVALIRYYDGLEETKKLSVQGGRRRSSRRRSTTALGWPSPETRQALITAIHLTQASVTQIAVVPWHDETDLHLENVQFSDIRQASSVLTVMFDATKTPSQTPERRRGVPARWQETPWRMILTCLATTVRHSPFGREERKAFPTYPGEPDQPDQAKAYSSYMQITRPTQLGFEFHGKPPEDPESIVRDLVQELRWQVADGMGAPLGRNEVHLSHDLYVAVSWRSDELHDDDGDDGDDAARIGDEDESDVLFRRKLGTIHPSTGGAVLVPGRPWTTANPRISE